MTHHKIRVTISIDIPGRCTVAHGRPFDAPLLGDIVKLQIPTIPKDQIILCAGVARFVKIILGIPKHE